MKQLRKISLLLALFAFGWNASAQTYSTGANIDINMYNKAELGSFKGMGFVTSLPASVSYKQFTPVANDQGQYGTCVGWSSAYGTFTTAYARQHNITNRVLITAISFDPYFNYSMALKAKDASCESGTFNYDALLSMRQNGLKRTFMQELGCDADIPQRFIDNARNVRIKDFKRLFTYPKNWDGTWETFFKYDVDKVTPVKEALANGHPVQMSMRLPGSIFTVGTNELWEATAAERANPTGQETYGHAMTIVGYDDNKHGGAFEVMNSWGQEWGNRGFFWVKYQDFKMFGSEAYYIELFDAKTKGCAVGDCDNSYSRYYFENGDWYEGELKGSTFNGHGMYVWTNGDVFAGSYRDGVRHGSGTFITADGNIIRGHWDNGLYVEYPVSNPLTDPRKLAVGCIEGDCQNGYGVMVTTDEGKLVKYTGTFKNGQQHGFGTFELPDGTRITSTWKNGSVDGIGKIDYSDNMSYVGEWMANQRTGFGVMYSPFGMFGGMWLFNEFLEPDASKSAGKKLSESKKATKFAGDAASTPTDGTAGCLSGNCTNGFGKIKYTNGNEYEGYFKDSRRFGHGTLTFTSGAKYEGFFLNDMFDGVGKYSFPSGEYYIGDFRNGRQDGYGVEVGDEHYIVGIWEFGEFKPGKSSLGFAKEAQAKTSGALNLDTAGVTKALEFRMNSAQSQAIK